MKVEILKTIEELKNIKEEWEELENKEKETTIFQTYLYNYTWWETVKDLNKYVLNIIVVRDNNLNLLGIAPLVTEKLKKAFLEIKVLRFMAWGDYLGFLIKTDNTNSGKIISEIFKKIDKLNIDKLLLSNIDINSILGICLKRHQKYSYLMEFQVECPRIRFNDYKNFEEFKIQNLSTSVKKQRNKMLKELEYKFISENNLKNNQFYNMSKIHQELKAFLNKLDKSNKRKTLYENREKNNFLEKYYKLSENINNFLMYDENNNIIIYDSSYFFNNRFFSWNMAHSSKYNSYNPGRVINYEIIEWCFNQKNKDLIFDFGCGGYPWKFQWTNDFTSVYKLEYDIKNTKKIKLFNKIRLLKRGVKCLVNIFKK